MGMFKPRKRPLSIRKIKSLMVYANRECKRRIDELNKSGKLCSCPDCKGDGDVTYKGTNRKKKKFVCDNREHRKPIWFSTSTSFEAIEIYRDAMANNLCQLMHANSVIDGIRKINETSKYFVELPLERLYEFIKEDVSQPSIKIDEDVDFVTVFMDLSGSGLARNKAMIFAKVGDKVIFDIVTTSNHLSTHQLLSVIKGKIQIPKKTKMVFITDGERCFIDSIKHFFPDAVHIRQFHKKSCRGIIYIHLKFGEVYTIRATWDIVLEEGEPSKQAIRMRQHRAKKKLTEKERKKTVRYSELSKEIIVWKGTVYAPRGIRRRLPDKGSKRESTKVDSSEGKENTSSTDTPELIFKGEIREAKNVEVFSYCFGLLKKIFAGLYITSNMIENLFNVKSKFKPHRTMKFGERILVSILYGHFVLNDMNKKELIEFLKKKVVTYDFLQQNVLYGSGLQKNKPPELSFLDVIREAFQTGKKLIIHYCDRNNKHTSRFITPLKIKENSFNGTTLIESFCHLRKEKRTFYLERIRDVAIYDPTPVCF